MKIREEQMEVFQKAADLRFQHWLVTHLRERHPRAVENMPNDVLEQRVAAGINRASKDRDLNVWDTLVQSTSSCRNG